MRPLTISELTEALVANQDDSNDLSIDDLPDDIDDEYVNGEIIRIRSSLVEIRETTIKQDLKSRTVHLTHFSVKQDILHHLSAATPTLLHLKEAIQHN